MALTATPLAPSKTESGLLARREPSPRHSLAESDTPFDNPLHTSRSNQERGTSYNMLSSGSTLATTSGDNGAVKGNESEPEIPTAARRVYLMPELFLRVCEMVDRPMLASMLRLSKAGMASVAGVLYRQVHVSKAFRMSRATATGAIYCDSVRILDRSPPASAEDARSRITPNSGLQGLYFDPSVPVGGLAEKFPRLAKILYEYPSDDRDDAYVAHIRDGKVYAVDLESHVLIRTSLPFPNVQSSIFPHTPVFEGITIRHTIAFHVVLDVGSILGLSAQARVLLRDRLKAWLYANPDLDRRVTSIDHTEILASLQLSTDEAMAFLAQRRKDECEPVSGLIITECPVDRLQELATALQSSNLRDLRIVNSISANHDEFATALATIAASLPSLRSLSVRHDYCLNAISASPLASAVPAGLCNLRTLRIDMGYGGRPEHSLSADSSSQIARFFCQLGSGETFFRSSYTRKRQAIPDFDALVKQWKRLVPAAQST